MTGSASPLRSAAGLSLAAAVSLGLARFAYALLLPPMRADLGWSYFTSGAMNTANAAGYLVGALLAPVWLARRSARSLLVGGGVFTMLLLGAHGLVVGDAALLALRLLSGVASAVMFVSGGLLAARLASAHAGSAGLVLGVFYGGTGAGVVASALVVPAALALPRAHAWQAAWVWMAALALLATVVVVRATRIAAPVAAPTATPGAAGPPAFAWRPFAFALVAYTLFGVGYIGYMTFIVTLLREQGLGSAVTIAFYVVLGCGVMASPWIWAGLLQRHRGGLPLAVLSALLALATLLPVVATNAAAAFVSGAVFGCVFLSLVASTTALVRHNLAPAAWPRGIAAFTIVFALGQIVGPVLVGWVADGPGGLQRGFVLSAAVLALGALFAARQRSLGDP